MEKLSELSVGSDNEYEELKEKQVLFFFFFFFWGGGGGGGERKGCLPIALLTG